MKNKHFTIIGFHAHAEKVNFWDFQALKSPIFIIMTPFNPLVPDVALIICYNDPV